MSRPCWPIKSYDCGTIALFYFLRLQGNPVDIGQVEAILPPTRSRGYTMKELRDAGRALGTDTRGAQVKRQDDALDRPMLVFLRQGDHGHYAVIRPVGHSGKLVQVIDQARPPEVMEKSDLFASPEWTGLVLIPSGPDWRTRTAFALIMVASALLVALALRRLRRPDREQSRARTPCSEAQHLPLRPRQDFKRWQSVFRTRSARLPSPDIRPFPESRHPGRPGTVRGVWYSTSSP